MQSTFKKPMLKTLAIVPAFLLSVSAWAFNVNFVSPIDQSGYLTPVQSIDVKIAVTPTPDPIYTLLFKVDGQYVSANQYETTLATAEYEAGNHLLTAELQDETGRVVASDSRTIYIVPPNNLARQAREKAAQQAAYDALPWYKKIGVKIGLDGVRLSVPVDTATRPAAEGGEAVQGIIGVQPVSTGVSPFGTTTK